MKRLLVAVLCAAIGLIASAQNFSIEGRLTDVRNDTLHIEYTRFEPERERVKASVPIDSAGRFSYACTIGYAYNACLTTGRNRTYFFFVPDESARIVGRSNRAAGWRIEGSAFYREMESAQQLVRPFVAEQEEAKARCARSLAEGADPEQAKAEYGAAMREINLRMYEVARRYIDQHPDRESSATLLMDLASADILPAIGALIPDVRNGRFKSYLDGVELFMSNLTREAKAAAAAKKELREHEQAPDFTLGELGGGNLRLGSLFGRGKYVVIDFWGSWCSWCIKGFPRMAACYDRYRERLEIVGVACRDKKAKWSAAVGRNDCPWRHVFSEDGTTEVRFGVSGYPYKVVISPEGVVLKCFTGETEAFYAFLDELLD